MMSSTTVASRAYAVVPARRSRWSHGGASRPSSAPAAGSARHRADASRRDRAARSPDPQPASCRRSFRRGFRARAAPSTRHRRCPRPDQQPLSGCVGRDVLAGACVPNPGAAGAVPVRVRSRSSAGLRWTRGRLWHPRRQHRPLHTGPGSGDRCKGRRFAPRRMYVPGILSSQPSQVCLPSHGTVPERRANVQKGARPRGTDRRCSVPFRGSAGRRKDAGTRWLGCCPPERSTGETHPRAKRPMNRAKTPLRRRAAPFFKWIKQHLKVKRFVGRTKNAVLSQLNVYVPLLAYLKFVLRLSWSAPDATSSPAQPVRPPSTGGAVHDALATGFPRPSDAAVALKRWDSSGCTTLLRDPLIFSYERAKSFRFTLESWKGAHFELEYGCMHKHRAGRASSGQWLRRHDILNFITTLYEGDLHAKRVLSLGQRNPGRAGPTSASLAIHAVGRGLAHGPWAR